MYNCCYECNKTHGNFHSVKVHHLVDGEYVSLDIALCTDCFAEHPTEGAFFYCFECKDLYRAPLSYWKPNGMADQMCAVPCPEHSLDESEPVVRCAVTGNEISILDARPTKRGYYFHHMCEDDIQRCAASYCRVWLHPDMDDVVKSGMNYYCSDCAEAKTVPDNAPSGYHPLSWNYREGCACSVCTYLNGRSDRWPEATTQECDSACTSCDRMIVAELAMNNFGNPVCHICEHEHYFTCYGCGHFYHLGAHSEVNPPPPNGHKYCSDCLHEDPNVYYCDAGCNAFWKDEVVCACGGVHKYNYSPEPIFQWGEKQREVPHNQIPFLGFELEVEAHGKDASRPAGAALVRSMADDFSYLVHDGTLKGTKMNGTGGQHGFEIVTHPFTWEWFEENWPRIEGILQTLAINGYRSWEGQRCGIHIHVSREPMTDLHQMKFIRFIYGCTNLAMAIGQRGYNDKNLNKFAPFHKEERGQLIQKIRANANPGIEQNKHYTAVNTNKPSTIEARWFRGTLKPSSFRKNLEFVHSLWYFTKAYGFQSANEINFINWLNEAPQRQQYWALLSFIEREYITRR